MKEIRPSKLFSVSNIYDVITDDGIYARRDLYQMSSKMIRICNECKKANSEVYIETWYNIDIIRMHLIKEVKDFLIKYPIGLETKTVKTNILELIVRWEYSYLRNIYDVPTAMLVVPNTEYWFDITLNQATDITGMMAGRYNMFKIDLTEDTL